MLFAQAAETSGTILAQWGAPGAIILVQFAAIVWLAKQLLASNDRVVAVLKEGIAAKEAGDEKDRQTIARLTDTMVANTRATEEQAAAVRELRGASQAQTVAIDRVNESVTSIIRDAIARRQSSQTTPAVKP